MFLQKLDAPHGISFDDVLLVPARSYVDPDHTDIKSRFSKNIVLGIPIVSAAMEAVTEAGMAIAVAREGGIGVIHGNMPREAQAGEVKKVKRGEDLVHDVITASPAQTIDSIWKTMAEHGITGVPVTENGRLVGVISRRDVRPFIRADPGKRIAEVMTRAVVTAREGVRADEAIAIMYEHKVERLPVVDDKGRLTGIISMLDIVERHQYPDACRDGGGRLRVAAAVGPFDIERAMALDKAGADALCVDCANAQDMRAVESARRIKRMVSADVVVGNVATAEACEDLTGFADGIKVGIGSGSACTIRSRAGVGVPQLTAIAGVADAARPAGIPVIADGGVRCPGDVARAIAAGADCVMLGSLLAGTSEAPGRLITVKGRKYKQYQGPDPTDRHFNEEVGGGAIPYRGAVYDTIYRLTGGLRMSMGYCGANNIGEMQEKSRFIRVTPAGLRYAQEDPLWT